MADSWQIDDLSELIDWIITLEMNRFDFLVDWSKLEVSYTTIGCAMIEVMTANWSWVQLVLGMTSSARHAVSNWLIDGRLTALEPIAQWLKADQHIDLKMNIP